MMRLPAAGEAGQPRQQRQRTGGARHGGNTEPGSLKEEVRAVQKLTLSLDYQVRELGGVMFDTFLIGKNAIIATEDGVFHSIMKQVPEKVLYQAPGMDESCVCNRCPYMRLNTLEKLYDCLASEGPCVTVPEELAKQALLPIEKMLALS